MQHGIRLVDDEELPPGHDFVFVGTPDGGRLIFYRQSAISAECLEDSWAAYRALGGPNRKTPTSSVDVPQLRRVI